MLSQSDAFAVTTRLESLYVEIQADMKSHWYWIGSGQPEQNLGALRIAHDTTIAALTYNLDAVLAGTYDSAKWIGLANDAEASMRAINGYTKGASVTTGISEIATQTAKDAGNLAASGARSLIKLLPIWAIPLLIVTAIGVVFFAVWRLTK